MDRTNISTGTVWEQRVGYSRVVRKGPFVFAAGTLAVDEHGEVVAPHSAYRQTLAALEKIEAAMKRVGADRRSVVRTRMYILHLRDQEEVGRAHKEFFGDVMPASTMLEIKGLAAPNALVEIELDAVISED
jgi:enamine deaminase RidA (YjgF/YER057c/UK114 family)